MRSSAKPVNGVFLRAHISGGSWRCPDGQQAGARHLCRITVRTPASVFFYQDRSIVEAAWRSRSGAVSRCALTLRPWQNVIWNNTLFRGAVAMAGHATSPPCSLTIESRPSAGSQYPEEGSRSAGDQT